MAKNIRWQIPFVSDIDKTKYRIDIYDEGSFTPVQLAGGPTPFVTNENNDTDFFAPVRSQTGTIQVCTAIPGGGTLSLNDILPANNIARPVRLVSISGSTETIEWQGFLSCEAYSQDYIGIPQVLDIPVISVLEAMDSVEMDMTLVTGIKKTRFFIYYALTELDRQCGMTDPFFSTIFYSRASSNFMQQYIDATVLYSVNEYTNEESYSYVVSGMSCKQAIERVCKFMGWVIREKGTSVFLNRMSDELTVYQQDLSNISQSDTTFISSRSQVTYTSANLSAQVWRGTGHKKNLTQGAKSVEVVANLIRYDMEMGMPEIPTDSLQHYDAGVLEAWATMDNEFNNMLTFLYYQMTVRETSGGYDLYQSGDADIEDAFADCVVSPDCDIDDKYVPQIPGTAYVCVRNCGAYVGRFNFSGQGETNWIDGLYVTAANEMEAANHVPSVFKMDSIISYTLVDGSLKLTVHGITFLRDALASADPSARIIDFGGKAYFKLRFGNKYWNGTNWQTSETFFEADFDNDESDDEEPGDYILTIPIVSQLTGSITLEIGGGIRGGSQISQQVAPTSYYQPDYDLLFTELKLEHVEAEYVEKSENSENKYFRLLGGNFRDEVSISTELASSLNNRPSPSLVMQDTNTAMRYLNYITTSAGATEPRRPEVDLLDRLAAYYGAARQRLELEVAHPTAAPLPLLKLNGIGDSKVYLPLSESRDWKADISTLTCFETPN